MIELVRHIYDTSSYPMFFIFFTVVMAFILFYAILDNLTKMISSMCSTIGHFAKNKKTKSEKERMRDLLHKEQELVMVWTEIGDAL